LGKVAKDISLRRRLKGELERAPLVRSSPMGVVVVGHATNAIRVASMVALAAALHTVARGGGFVDMVQEQERGLGQLVFL
jgi:hypothetical protein